MTKLRCPKCRWTINTKPQDGDPPGTHTVEVVCPKCDTGDFCESHFFDVRGEEIPPDAARKGGE